MKTMMTRLFLVVLSLILCVGVFAACGDPGDKGDAGDGKNPGGTIGDGVENRVEPNVPDTKYNDTFTVLHYEHPGWLVWDEIIPSTGMEQRPGDLLGNDVFDRANWLLETYGVTLDNENKSHSTFAADYELIHTSGSTEYQLVDMYSFEAQKMVGRDYFLNLYDVDYIDFNNPWWVDSAIESYSIGNFIEFAVSDMLLLDKGATGMVFYNIPMSIDLGITELYDDVTNYEWTIERMAEYAEMAWEAGDLDGNNIWDYSDQYGVITGDDPVHFLYVGSGNKYVTFDADAEDGEWYSFSYGSSDEQVDVMLSILEDMMYQDFLYNDYLRDNGSTKAEFKKNQALFTFGKAKSCTSLRDMQDDYGILPVPMYTEDQEKYYSQVSSYGDSIFAVPTANFNNQAMVGAVLEVLGYYSYYEIYPDLFETVIQGRGTRDQESKEMLDLIFSNRVYDLALLYDPNHITDKILRITGQQTTNVQSHWDELENKRTETLEILNDLYRKYNIDNGEDAE